MMVRLSFILALFATTVASAPVYQPAFHGPLPGHEHEFNLQHVKHVDEQGRVTYIHDSRDHRPDFCAMPGEDELCRQQIEAAKNAPADDDTIILTTPHKDDELAPGNDALAHETTSLDAPQPPTSDVHASDTTITLDNGNVITIHNDNGHVRNLNDGAINMERPPADGGHVPNINPHPQSMHRETIKEDIIPDLITVPHQRNINDIPSPVDGPVQDGGHVPNINTHPQSMHRETIKASSDIIPDLITVPHQRNINDDPAPVDGPQDSGHVPNINTHPQSMHRETIKEEIIPDQVTVPHQRNINDNPAPVDGPAQNGGHFPNVNPQQGQSVSEKASAETPSDVPQSPFPGALGPHTLASHPINKLQEAIRKTQA